MRESPTLTFEREVVRRILKRAMTSCLVIGDRGEHAHLTVVIIGPRNGREKRIKAVRATGAWWLEGLGEVPKATRLIGRRGTLARAAPTIINSAATLCYCCCGSLARPLDKPTATRSHVSSTAHHTTPLSFHRSTVSFIYQSLLSCNRSVVCYRWSVGSNFSS